MRLLAVTPADNMVRILAAMQALAGARITHLVTLGDRDADYKASSLLRLTQANGQRGHVMAGDTFSGAARDLTRATDFPALLLEAMDTLQRGAAGHNYRNHALIHPSDYLNYTCLAADRLASILVQDRIDTLLFFDIPHLFYDSLLYRLARQMGLRTLILRSTLTPGRFFSMARIEDLGGLADGPAAAPIRIDPGKAMDLHYMKGIAQEPGPRGRLSWRALAHLAAHVATQQPGLLLRPARLAATVARMVRVARALPDCRDPFARFFHTDSLAYAETIAGFEDAPVDLTQSFVYFPLQLQPEMTTAILGGLYRDQALAIEHLAAMLPADTLIYVKENPKQTGQYRGPMFFHRLARIPAVRFMPSHANTHALTRAARFVATISGTVAWEAVTADKPALLFGTSWMAGLPGVVRYRDGLRFDDVAERPIDHAALEAAYGRLMAAAHPGVVARHEGRTIAGFSETDNTQIVATTILDLLEGRLRPSFGAALQ
jgi:hypothetical protein